MRLPLRLMLMAAAVVAVTAAGCRSGWSQLGKKCFKVSTDKRPADGAKTTCRAAGARCDLASIDSSQTQDFVAELIPLFVNKLIGGRWGQVWNSEEVYIGLLEGGSGRPVRWTDGSGVIYTNYAPGNPAAGNAKTCFFMSGIQQGKWVRNDCKTLLKYVCICPESVAS